MSFSEKDRAALLAVKGVGPTVVARLEQMGFRSLAQLAVASVTDIVTTAASLTGSTCWKNSPQARAAIQRAIERAQSELP
ncbi:MULTISPECIES: helix-hairpin-helix domain-containing protein [Cupriavidus]